MRLTQSHGRYYLTTYRMRSNRGGSDCSWMAEIVGTCPKFRFRRVFVGREVFQSRPTNDGEQTFGPLDEGRIYEYRAVACYGESLYAYSRGIHLSGFFKIVDGKLAFLAIDEVYGFLDQPAVDVLSASTG